jgi:hypothetical protein
MAIARVSQGTNGYAVGTCGAANNIPITLQQAPVNGNILVAVIGTFSSSFYSCNNITTSNVDWVTIGGLQKKVSGTTYLTTEIWVGIVGANAGTAVVINLTGTIATYGGIAMICEYSGVATSSFLDVTAPATGGTGHTNNVTSIATGTTTTTTANNELWIGSIFHYSGGGVSEIMSNPTSGFTLLNGGQVIKVTGAGNLTIGLLEKIVTSTGAANSSVTTSNSDHWWAGCIATFKAVGGTQHSKTLTNLIGVLDSLSIHKIMLNFVKTFTDAIGAFESYSMSMWVAFVRTFTDVLGVMHSRIKHRAYTILLGLKDLRGYSEIDEIKNGGYETGNLNNWTHTGNSCYVDTHFWTNESQGPHSGTYLLNLSGVYGADSVYQLVHIPLLKITEFGFWGCYEDIGCSYKLTFSDNSTITNTLLMGGTSTWRYYNLATVIASKSKTLFLTKIELIVDNGNICGIDDVVCKTTQLRLMTFNRIYTSLVGLVDSFVKHKGLYKTLADVLGVIDSQTNLTHHLRTFLNKVGLADNKTVNKVLGTFRWIWKEHPRIQVLKEDEE